MSKSCCTVPARAESRDLARSDSDVPAYRPHTDIYETEDGVVLLVDLPGVPEGSVDLAVDGDILSLTATSLRSRPEGLELGHGELGGQGVHFLAVDSGEDEATVREYVERNPFPYPVLLDPEDTLSSRYQLYGLPTVMVIDRQGAISFLETGVSDAGRLRRVLEKAGAEIV